jgi:hypothetical protein
MENFKKFVILFISIFASLNIYFVIDEVFTEHYPPTFFKFSEIWPLYELVIIVPVSLVISCLGLLAINWRIESGYKRMIALLIIAAIFVLFFAACVWLIFNLK